MEVRKKILVADGNRSVGQLIRDILTANGYETLYAHTGSAVLTAVRAHCPDAVLLNFSLPDTDCFDILRYLRDTAGIRVIVISTAGENAERFRLIEAGAEDYLSAPFSTAKLLDSVRSAANRGASVFGARAAGSERFEVDGLLIDFHKVRVTVGGRDVKVTAGEFKTIALLCRFAGKVLTHNYIIRCLWDSDDRRHERTLRVNIANLRRKIEKDPDEPRYIFTEKGVGYHIADE